MTLVAASVMLGGLAVSRGQDDAPQAAGQAQPPGGPDAATADLLVTLQHVSGKSDQFRGEVVSLELILDAAGRLDQVHLVTRTGPEADTHIWYNVENLVSVRYQFLAITGKGKVSVRTVAPPPVRPPATPARPSVRPLEPEDYR
jgi:hypothetical protein